MDQGALLLVGLTVLAALVLVTVGVVAFSMFAGSGSSLGSSSVPCCYRSSAEMPWRRGTLRYDHDRVDHYGSGGLSVRRQHRWSRARLDLGRARPLMAGDCPALAAKDAPATVVACRYGEESFELALGHGHYTALRSWLESVPPGWNANVA